MTNLEILEINYNNVKNDFRNHNVDLYVAKIELETIISKLMKEQSVEIIDLIYKAKKLLEEVNHEIKLQENENHFNSYNTEI